MRIAVAGVCRRLAEQLLRQQQQITPLFDATGHLADADERQVHAVREFANVVIVEFEARTLARAARRQNLGRGQTAELRVPQKCFEPAFKVVGTVRVAGQVTWEGAGQDSVDDDSIKRCADVIADSSDEFRGLSHRQLFGQTHGQQTRAFGILNLYSCDTGIQKIKRHNADEADVLHYNATWQGLCDTYRGGDGRYFLTGSRALLDAPEEWLLDQEASEILVASRPDNAAEVRGRVTDYALMMTNTTWLQIANISFFAATLSITGAVANITLSSLTFNYSGVSRRALNDTVSPPIALTLWRPQIWSDTAPSGFVIEDLTVRYSDGPALMASGNEISISDCLFEWNDWTAVGGSWPALDVPRNGKAQRATTVWIDDPAGLQARRMTFRNNGCVYGQPTRGDDPRTIGLISLPSLSSLSLSSRPPFLPPIHPVPLKASMPAELRAKLHH